MVAHAVVSCVRWAREPASGLDAENRAETRKMYRAAGRSAGLAALLTAIAFRAAGGHRIALGVGAVVALFHAG